MEGQTSSPLPKHITTTPRFHHLSLSHILVVFCVILVVFYTCPTLQQAHHHHHLEGYSMGEKFHVECLNSSGEWVPSPVCQESGELSFQFGVDSFLGCGVRIPDDEQFKHWTSIVGRQKPWSCRVLIIPMASILKIQPPPKTLDPFYLHFAVGTYGITEQDHFHMDTHLNFVFHGYTDRIVGVAAYTVRDRPGEGTVGGVLSFHGSVKWFGAHSYDNFSKGRTTALRGEVSNVGVPGVVRIGGRIRDMLIFISWMAVTSVASFFLFGLVYKFYLKKRIIAKMVKRE